MEIHAAVRSARVAAKLSQSALATEAGLSPRQVQVFEGGDLSAISTADLARIASALGLDFDALLAGEAPPPSAKVFFRQNKFPDFRAEDLPRLERALDRARALVAVNALLGRGERPTRFGFEPRRIGDRPYRDGYRLATRVRGALGNASEPLLDLQTIVEEQFDILILVEELSRRVQAASVRDSHTGAAAIIHNSANRWFENAYRQRTDLAHELGHVLFDPSKSALTLVADSDVEGELVEAEPMEQRAKAFAAELLMPRVGLDALLGPPRETRDRSSALELVRQAREHFLTSHELAVNHLINTRFVDPGLRGALLKSPATLSSTPGTLRPVSVLERRVAAALTSAQISRMRASELLGLSPWDPLPPAVESVPA